MLQIGLHPRDVDRLTVDEFARVAAYVDHLASRNNVTTEVDHL